ncbi:MAG: HlyD family secretion protein [Alphaproteobacteria bacterium]
MTSSAEPDTRTSFSRAASDRDLPAATRPARPLRQRLRLPLMIAGPVVVLLVAGWWYLTSGRYVSTDDAYVQAARTMVSADVPGRVVAVAVHDNERVSRGQVLFRIDDKTFRIAVEEAKAALAAAKLQVQAMQATYNQKLADLKAAEETLAYQQREFERQRQLLANGNAPRSTFDQVQNAMQVARQKVVSAQSDLANMLAQLGGDPSLPVDEHPMVQKAQAALDKAEYDLERTVVRAPSNGIVTKVEQLQVGSYVNAAAPVFSMISNRVWIEANFKETELTHMRPGQKATVAIDTYPDAMIEATVESLSPGTGLTFSLLPAENATGNWVKVVQRLPVRLSLADPPADLPLHAGLSATVEVDTKHRRPWLVWLADRAGGLFGTAQAHSPQR